MGYLPDFEYDIFISYAHVDNLAASGQKGWVAQFCEHLEVRLWKRFGKRGAVRIWWDPSLDGNQLFDRTIKEAIDRSALFVSLNSTGYVESDYCRQELKWFCEKASREPLGMSAGDRLRVFNLLLNNIPFGEWPEEFGRTSGYPFHDAGREDEFGEPSDPADKLFQQQLRELVDAIHKTLCSMEKSAPAVAAQIAGPTKEEPSPNQSSTQASNPASEPLATVFVADTSDSLRTTRRRVINELEQNGIRIISNIPPPYEGAPHDERIIAEVARADLSIHLLDNLSGREIEGSPGKSYPQRQAELSVEHAKSQLIWIPPSLDMKVIEDDSYKNFINHLENDSRGEGSYCFMREPATAITREALERINQLKAAAARPQAPSAALVDTHLKDQLHALELSQLLLRRNVQPYINPEEDDPRKNMKIFEERLKQVSRLIIIFGEVAQEWVLERLGVALQIAIVERCPLKSCGIYFAPPRKKTADAQFNLGFLPVYMFDSDDINNPQAFTHFLEGTR